MKNIADMRKDYKARELDEASCLDDPVVQFQIWLDEAITADVDEPTAMLVSTVSPGRAASRASRVTERCGKRPVRFFHQL